MSTSEELDKDAPRNKGKRAEENLRWSLNRAAHEFGLHQAQLDRRRRALGMEPGADGFYSSRDIAAMMFGDKEAETIGKIAAERKSTELSNARQMGELIPTEVACALVERVLIAVKQRFMSSSLSEQEKTDVLEELVSLGHLDWSDQAKRAAKKK